jgi:hypothetical protein
MKLPFWRVFPKGAKAASLIAVVSGPRQHPNCLPPEAVSGVSRRSDPFSLSSARSIFRTTSRAEQDILSSYQMRANAYVTKPGSFDHFSETISKNR